MTVKQNLISDAEIAAFNAKHSSKGRTAVQNPSEGSEPFDRTLRDHKAEAEARAIANRNAAGEAAGLITETVIEDTNAAHEERKLDIKAALRALLDCFQGEPYETGDGSVKDELSYLRSNILDRMAYRAYRMIETKEKQLFESADQLSYLRRRNKGGEIDDAKVQRKLGWIRNIEFEQEAWADLLEASEDVYYSETGEPWYPRDFDGKAADRAAQTAANAEADNVLARIKARKEARKKAA